MQPAGAVPFRPENQYVGLVPLQLYTRRYKRLGPSTESPQGLLLLLLLLLMMLDSRLF
jgi:hypothetical protein